MEPLMLQNLSGIRRSQSPQLQRAYRKCSPLQAHQLLRLLTARQQQTTLMLRLTNQLQQFAIDAIPIAIRTDAGATVQHGLKIIQHEQTAMATKIVEQELKLRIKVSRRNERGRIGKHEQIALQNTLQLGSVL